MATFSMEHLFLAHGATQYDAEATVKHFLDRSQLIHYDVIALGRIYSPADDVAAFQTMISHGMARNRETLQGYIAELQSLGLHTIDDLGELVAAYPSKILHIIAHIVDGFIDVDSHFYNLIEDSHWVSRDLEQRVAGDPHSYWLIEVRGQSSSKETAALIHS